jgi:hypothetical protein
VPVMWALGVHRMVTDSAPIEPVERCPDCGRPRFVALVDGHGACKATKTWPQPAEQLECARRAIARLRSELATIRETYANDVAEIAHVPEFLDERFCESADDHAGAAIALAVINDIYNMRGAWESRLIAVREKYTLVAHRAQKGADDGTGR